MLNTQGFAEKRKSSVAKAITYVITVCIVVSAIYFMFAQIYVNGVSSGYMVDAETAPPSDAVYCTRQLGTDVLRRSSVFGGEMIHISGSGMLTQD